MMYPNATHGLERVYQSQVIALVAAVLMIIPVINVLAAIALIVSLVLYMIGINEAGKDDENYKTAFTLIIVQLVISVLNSLIGGVIFDLVNEALALAVLTGCSALMGGTVQKDTEQAKALMKEVAPSLTYNTDLEDAASRLADWLVEDSTQLTTQSGLLTRKVPMTTGSGAMLDTNVYDFIDHSTSFLFLPRGVVIGLAMNNEWGFTGYLYAPPLSEAGSALRSYAAGCKQMGAVFIEYGGETYVVAMFA